MVQWIAFKTIVRREFFRFIRLWVQTILPSMITISLYFIIFGNLIGSQINHIQGYTYMEYITPGLIMLAVINNSYANVSGSFFSLRFQGCIDELLIAPVKNWVIMAGFVLAGIIRGMTVGLAVSAIASFYTTLHIQSYTLFISILFLTATMCSLAGLLNALYARRFDDIAFVPTFVLTPLIYLGGVFYPLKLLSPFWQKLSLMNPILYIVNAFRYSMLGLTDVTILIALIIVAVTAVGLWICNLRLLNDRERITIV